MIEIRQDYRQYGDTPSSVVVLHGGPGGAGEVEPFARELGRRGHDVLEPFQKGRSVSAQVDELRSQIDAYCSPPVVVIGWSWGAWLGCLFAARHNALIRNLILVGSGPFEARFASAIRAMKNSRLTHEQRIELEAFVSHAGYKELETEFNRLLWRRRADISAGRTPEGRGLIVVGNSGSGKTTAVDRLTARHPQLNLGQDGSVKLEALSVRVPSPASLKFVGEKTLHGFGLKIERNKTSNCLWDKVQFHARNRGTLFVHYDEAQDFISNSKGTEIKPVMNTLKSFMQNKDWPVGLILSGLPWLKELMNLDPQLWRRFKPIHFPQISYATHGPEIMGILESYINVVGLKTGRGIDNKFFLRQLINAASSEFGIAVEMIVGAIEEALLEDSKDVSIDNFAEMYRSRVGCVDALNPFVTDDFKVIDAGKLLGGVDNLMPEKLNQAIDSYRRAS